MASAPVGQGSHVCVCSSSIQIVVFFLWKTSWLVFFWRGFTFASWVLAFSVHVFSVYVISRGGLPYPYGYIINAGLSFFWIHFMLLLCFRWVKVIHFGDYNICHCLIVVDFGFARAFCLLSVFITRICRRLTFSCPCSDVNPAGFFILARLPRGHCSNARLPSVLTLDLELLYWALLAPRVFSGHLFHGSKTPLRKEDNCLNS